MKNLAFIGLIVLFLIILVNSFHSANFSTAPYIPIILALISAIVFLYISRKKPIAGSYLVTLIFLAGLLLRIAYLSETPPFVRGHDVRGHICYIDYISNNHSLPSANDCWEGFHPPLYYISVSPVCYFGSCSGDGEGLLILQLLSLLASVGFLYFGIKLLRLCIPEGTNDRYFNLAAMLLVFWPAGIITSVAINNDALSYFFIAGGAYFITKWFKDARWKSLLLSAIFLIASLLTKGTGIVLFAFIICAILLKLILAKNKKEILIDVCKIMLPAVLILLCFAGLRHSKFYGNKAFDFRSELNPNAMIMTDVLTTNDIKNFITFDLRAFVQHPFMDPSHDTTGRQYFLNFFLKSSLFGEYRFDGNKFAFQAILMSYLLILMILIIVVGLIFIAKGFIRDFFAIRSDAPMRVLILSSIALMIVSAIVGRYLYPYFPSSDFRFVYPIVIPISVLLAYIIADLRSKESRFSGFFAGLSASVVYLFVLSSVCFFASISIF